jgi:hypothetical protein
VNISEPFIRRPIATTLLMVAIGLAGAAAFTLLPVSPLPQVDFPTISVAASLPGASPETMASSVATPLERQFGRIAAVREMTSSSSARLDEHHAAVRSRPQHRRCGPRRPGSNQRGPWLSAGEPSDESELPKGEPLRLAHLDSVAHLVVAQQSRDV